MASLSLAIWAFGLDCTLNRVNNAFATLFVYTIVGLLGHLKEGHAIIQYIIYEKNHYDIVERTYIYQDRLEAI